MNRTKKVLHVTYTLGGVKTYLENIINCPAGAFQIAIAAPPHSEFQQLCKEKGIAYHFINSERDVRVLNDVKTLFRLVSIIKKERPDVVHAHSAKGGFIGRLAARVCGKKVVYTPHAFSYMSFSGIKRLIFMMLELVAKRWTNMIVAVSYSEAARARMELGYKEDKLQVVLNSIHTGEVARTVQSKNIKIGMIARLTQQKNPLLFLQIARFLGSRYDQCIFSILGAGLHDHLKDEMEKYIQDASLEGKVTIEEWGSNEKSVEFLSSIDIFVLTSAFEGLPFSLLEAMGKSIPCVVSKADGNSDVIQNNENGFACNTLADFCDKLDVLIRSKELRERIGAAGAAYVKDRHDMNVNMLHIEGVYKKVLNPLYAEPQLKRKKKVLPSLREEFKMKKRSSPSFLEA